MSYLDTKYTKGIQVIPSIFYIPSPSNIVGEGQTSAVLVDYLVDANANFIKQGVLAGATVYNLSTGLGAAVTNVSETQLELTDDIFGVEGEGYGVGNVVSGVGAAIWSGSGGDITGVPINQEFPIDLTNVPAGIILPIIFKIIDPDGTTATDMVALFE